MRDENRFRFGSILPDAENGLNGKMTHFKVRLPDGKKAFDLSRFRDEYHEEINADELYLGYYLHLVADAVYRRFVYEKHAWDPFVPGNVERLHNDYRLTNPYIMRKYGLTDCMTVPCDLEKLRIYGEFPFDVDSFLTEMKGDFVPYDGGEPFFFNARMADEYISEAADICEAEYLAFTAGKPLSFVYSWG